MKPYPRIANESGDGTVPIDELDHVFVYGHGKIMTTGGILRSPDRDGDNPAPGMILLVEAAKAKRIPSAEQILSQMTDEGFDLQTDRGEMVHSADAVFAFENVRGLDVLLMQLLSVRGLMVSAGHEDPGFPGAPKEGEGSS